MIKRIGIAKWTFYHYFHSKQGLPVELTDLFSDERLTLISNELEQNKCDALTQFREMSEKSLAWKTQNRKNLIELML
ncbi:MAG: hypothetical protein U5R06_10050 [candidate division KSB1 bacterium]|nr:hypothetical protein [candidate division KSB1 bacterium]